MARQLNFRGEFFQKVDSKGRVSIPARFRHVIERKDPDWVEGRPALLTVIQPPKGRNFLECYTVEAMERIDAAIARMPMGDPKRKQLEHIFSAKALEMDVDATGRLVLPKPARDRIGLEPGVEAYFKGANETFEIWNGDTHEAAQDAAFDEAFADLPEGADFTYALNPYMDR